MLKEVLKKKRASLQSVSQVEWLNPMGYRGNRALRRYFDAASSASRGTLRLGLWDLVQSWGLKSLQDIEDGVPRMEVIVHYGMLA